MEFVKTPVFTREIRRLLPDDEYHKLQIALVLRPDAGDLIHERGCLRKLRWRIPGHVKRGGLRVIYYWVVPDRIFMLLPLQKTVQEELTPPQLRTLRKLTEEWLQ